MAGVVSLTTQWNLHAANNSNKFTEVEHFGYDFNNVFPDQVLPSSTIDWSDIRSSISNFKDLGSRVNFGQTQTVSGNDSCHTINSNNGHAGSMNSNNLNCDNFNTGNSDCGNMDRSASRKAASDTYKAGDGEPGSCAFFASGLCARGFFVYPCYLLTR